jgi:hypothetical protein
LRLLGCVLAKRFASLQRESFDYVMRELAAVPASISAVILLNFKDLSAPGCILLSEVQAAVLAVP